MELMKTNGTIVSKFKFVAFLKMDVTVNIKTDTREILEFLALMSQPVYYT